MPRTTTTAAPNVTSGLRALSDLAWMARRQASTPTGQAQAESFNDACWLLHRMARGAGISMGHPDQSANREWVDLRERLVETPSFFADGAPVNYEPSEERAAELAAMDRAEAVQWIVTTVHPLAHAYADGRATYATGMCNDATRVLRAAGYDLSATEALGLSVWVTDGMGDTFLALSRAEKAEMDTARATVTG